MTDTSDIVEWLLQGWGNGDAVCEEAATALTAKDKEIEALKHDLDRYVSAASELATIAETAERERDIATRSHNSMSEMLTDIRRERDEWG